jgi:hypothetical protein
MYTVSANPSRRGSTRVSAALPGMRVCLRPDACPFAPAATLPGDLGRWERALAAALPGDRLLVSAVVGDIARLAAEAASG